MKRALFFLVFWISCIATGQDASKVAQLSGEAQRAYLAGDMTTAKAKFEAVLEIDRTNKVALMFLRKMAMEQRKTGDDPKGKLQALVLPKIEFREATFASCLDYLKQQAAEQSTTVSFVSELSPEEMQKKITLSLANVPFTEAVRYLCTLNGARYAIEPYAIVIKKAESVGASPSPAGQ